MNILPFIPSDPHYFFETTLNDVPYTFDVRWNDRDRAWYFDMFDKDDFPIVRGVKIVLGTYLGRRSPHEFFATNALVPVDMSSLNQDPGFDDLGTRVLVIHYTSTELAASALSL